MKLTTEHQSDIAVVRVGESRLMYPLLSDFASTVAALIESGERKLIVDLSDVSYVDRRVDRLPDGHVSAGGSGGRYAQARWRAETRRNHADDDGGAELHRSAPRRIQRREKLRSPEMHTIKTSTGMTLPLDGDLLAVVETLYKELKAQHGLDRSFEQMMQEIRHLVDQMDEADRRAYLIESLFLNTVTYENEKLGAYMRKLTNP